MSKVYLIIHHLLFNLRQIVAQNILGRFQKGDKIAVKCHLGEYGNLYYVRPPIVELVVDELKKIGCQPFLFDTPSLYQAHRDTVEKYLATARKNGFTSETMGCPVVISDQGLKLKSKYFGQIEIAKDLYEADGMIVISHFKSHELVTFGGAIKNIGMGGITREGKRILHEDNQPAVGESCTGCGTCGEVCPERAIQVSDKKAVVNSARCLGCGTCVEVCSNQALVIKTAPLAMGLAEVCSYFKKKFKEKIFYINVLLDIVDKCDCYPIGASDIGQIVCSNLGIACSDDLIAIDQASFDVVQKATDNKFGEIYHADPLKQIRAAQGFDLGSIKYELVD